MQLFVWSRLVLSQTQNQPQHVFFQYTLCWKWYMHQMRSGDNTESRRNASRQKENIPLHYWHGLWPEIHCTSVWTVFMSTVTLLVVLKFCNKSNTDLKTSLTAIEQYAYCLHFTSRYGFLNSNSNVSLFTMKFIGQGCTTQHHLTINYLQHIIELYFLEDLYKSCAMIS